MIESDARDARDTRTNSKTMTKIVQVDHQLVSGIITV